MRLALPYVLFEVMQPRTLSNRRAGHRVIVYRGYGFEDPAARLGMFAFGQQCRCFRATQRAFRHVIGRWVHTLQPRAGGFRIASVGGFDVRGFDHQSGVLSMRQSVEEFERFGKVIVRVLGTSGVEGVAVREHAGTAIGHAVITRRQHPLDVASGPVARANATVRLGTHRGKRDVASSRGCPAQDGQEPRAVRDHSAPGAEGNQIDHAYRDGGQTKGVKRGSGRSSPARQDGSEAKRQSSRQHVCGRAANQPHRPPPPHHPVRRIMQGRTGDAVRHALEEAVRTSRGPPPLRGALQLEGADGEMLKPESGKISRHRVPTFMQGNDEQQTHGKAYHQKQYFGQGPRIGTPLWEAIAHEYAHDHTKPRHQHEEKHSPPA